MEYESDRAERRASEGSDRQCIGPYRVMERLGSGGMGEVYRGYDERLDRPVALKRVRGTPQDAERASRRFKREARMIARLNHPSIVQVHDWVESDGQDWLVMELVKGAPLSAQRERLPLPVAEVVGVARSIGAGLAAAHRAGLVHRDLKPSNVMLTEDGVKILDFGVAKATRGDWETSHSTLTEDGGLVGTVPAMSPEQALGHAVGHLSDLFSFGSLLYEVATGVSPFRGRNASETLARICTWHQRPAKQLNPDVPTRLSHLIDRLLEKEPPLRPASAEQVLSELERVARELGSDHETVDESQDSILGVDTVVPLEDSVESQVSTGRILRRGLLGVGAVAALTWVLLLTQARRQPDATVQLVDSAAESSVPNASAMPYDHYRRGLSHLEIFYRAGQIQRAIESFKQAIALDVGYAPAYSGLARAYWEEYRFYGDGFWLDRALSQVNHALKLNPQLTSARVHRGLIWLSMGRAEKAHREFEEVLALDPTNSEAYRGLGDFYRSQGDVKAAAQAYRQALELRPDDIVVLGTIGVLQYQQGLYQEAAGTFESAIEIDPTEITNYTNLAAIYHMQDRYADASSLLQKALEIQPEAQIYSNLGTLYFFQGLYHQALSAFLSAIELGAKNYQAWGNLGDAYRWTPGNHAEAANAYRTAILLLQEELEKQPENAHLHATLAEYLAKTGNTTSALRQLTGLRDLIVADVGAYCRATVAAEIAGDRNLALETLRQALAAGYSAVEFHKDPELVELRKDPRFSSLVAEFATESSSAS